MFALWCFNVACHRASRCRGTDVREGMALLVPHSGAMGPWWCALCSFAGDFVLLATDGVFDNLFQEQILDLFQKYQVLVSRLRVLRVDQDIVIAEFTCALLWP